MKYPKKPNTLKQEMQKRGISTYFIIQSLGKNVRTMYGFWAKKLNGTVPMSYPQLEQICQIITDACPKQPLKPSEIKKEVINFYVR